MEYNMEGRMWGNVIQRCYCLYSSFTHQYENGAQVMEAMEEDRVEFLKSNVWEYANLASARLLIEDEVKTIS